MKKTFSLLCLTALSILGAHAHKTIHPSILPVPDSIATRSNLLMANQNSIIDFNPQHTFYTNSIQFSTGYALNTLRLDNTMNSYNDTSEHQFAIKGHTPIFSWTQNFALDSTFTLGYTVAYSNSEIYYDNTYYGSDMFYISFNPQLNIVRTYRFEYYFKLKIGVSYEKNNLSQIADERIQGVYPSGFRMFTGCTLIGLNYLISGHLAMNAEFSIWSPETVNCGISYRWFREKKNKQAYMDLNF